MLDWYSGLPWLLRLGVAIFFLLISTVVFFLGRSFLIWGWALGFVLLLFAFPNEAERKGYHDYR